MSFSPSEISTFVTISLFLLFSLSLFEFISIDFMYESEPRYDELKKARAKKSIILACCR